ncbi:fibroblast growth factor receptor-like 1 [Brachionus plicatilis]|uniref:Fibroblast growth factor receptor-like 1 n=1 Tax=Brachionus plicatilis TaxID=10195 RepID=A0A3M7Q550_BRAPC|nr:fibroblast growth factor receptor-like 1 [Brachionus plicatilis]
MKFLLTILIAQLALCRSQDLTQTTISTAEGEDVVLKCPIDVASQYMDEYDYDYDELERKKRQSPIAILQWYKDSLKLNKFTYIGKYEFEGNVLRILKVHLTDAGNYTCKLINGLGQLSRSMSVVVEKMNSTTESMQNKRPIETRKRPVPQKAPAFLVSNRITKFSKQKGEEVVFNCRAVGVPRSDIMWFKNGIILGEEEYGITRSKWSLNLKNLRTDDTGNFTCQVFNKHGSINATFELNVFDDTQVFEGLDPMNTTISSGMDAIFTCKVKSTYKPNIKWMKQISKAEYTNYVIQNSNNDLLKNKELNSDDLRSLYVFNSLPSLKFVEKNPQTSGYDDTFLNELITGKDNSNKEELDFEFFVPNDANFGSTTKKIETKHDDSIHYITLSSSPSIVQKFSYDRINDYYISQLTIKQASVKESGIYVCFGATNNGYSYRKSYLKVVPIVKPIQSFYPNNFYNSFKKDNYKDDIYFNNKPVVTTRASVNDNFMTIQSIGYIIIGVPVLLISIFALISICYLKKIESLKNGKKCEKKNSTFGLFKNWFKSNQLPKNTEKFGPTSRTLMDSSYDEKKMNSYAKNTLSTSASSEHTNTLQCVTSSLATSMSDSSSETTVAYYATIPLLTENGISPPPLPNSQPPTFSPVLANPTSAKYYGQTNQLKRVESNSSMAYYKIVDSESVPFNHQNCKYSNENDQQIVTEYKLDESTNTNRFYFQLAPVTNNKRSFSNNKKY